MTGRAGPGAAASAGGRRGMRREGIGIVRPRERRDTCSSSSRPCPRAGSRRASDTDQTGPLSGRREDRATDEIENDKPGREDARARHRHAGAGKQRAAAARTNAHSAQRHVQGIAAGRAAGGDLCPRQHRHATTPGTGPLAGITIGGRVERHEDPGHAWIDTPGTTRGTPPAFTQRHAAPLARATSDTYRPVRWFSSRL